MTSKLPNRRDVLKTSLGGALAAVGGTLVDKARAQQEAPINETIEEARRAALEVLKPSKRDLEHGLELHKESLVFDAYGFAPRAAVDGDAIKQMVLEGASTIELQDAREEMGMTRPVTDTVEREEFMQAWRASGVTCIFQNAGEEGQSPMRLLKRLARFTYLTDMMPEFVSKAVTPTDVADAKNHDRQCLYFTGNGVPLTQQWVSVEDELRYIRIFFQLGIRMMHMTYQRRNMIGDGCAEPANAGLSDFGRAVVREMNKVGVIADVAHSGWRTSRETAEASEKPVVASHSTCDALYHHIRAKPVDVIKAIADSGGYIGICCIPSFLGGRADIGVMMEHIDYVVQRFGSEHVAIGTDVAYTSRQSSAENQKIPKRGPTRKEWRSLWPEGSLGTQGAAPLSLAWTNWPLFTVGLVQRGYSDEDIQKIIGGNVMRVAREALSLS
ncbi:MAG: membrane dipeptidase [Planctomycetaceae bacterium]|nr:membrane dipeptidase [Planctomycetales bacterium]MCB9921419.1 membrane dipeptidase [Planctomycetaceae bacterium]